jgi:capsular polysaccharide biosynthesis protein
MTIKQAPSTLADIPEDGHGLSLADVIRIIRERVVLIALVTLLITFCVVGLSLAQTPKYEASTTILIGQEQGKTAGDPNLQSKVEGLQALAPVMTEAIDSRRVAEATIRQLNLRVTPATFVKNLSAEQVSDTPFIKVKYKAPSPGEAQNVANTVAEILPDQVSNMDVSSGPITATVWEQAVVPNDPVSPSPLRNGFVALILGLVFGVGLAFLLEYLDESWRSPQEVEQVAGVPTYALIPHYELHSDNSFTRRGWALRRERYLPIFFRSERPNGREEER